MLRGLVLCVFEDIVREGNEEMAAILTVDDSRAVRTIIAKQVRELGFEVLEAEDGVQGLEQLVHAAVDLVLLDVTMPNMDGPTMLRKMREAGSKTPVIMLTSESTRSIVAGAIMTGISDYILKPFKPEELRAKLLSVLQAEPGGEAVEDDDAAAAAAALAAAAAEARAVAMGGPAATAPKQGGSWT
jgi:DNA-binding response OmpR family regulator